MKKGLVICFLAVFSLSNSSAQSSIEDWGGNYEGLMLVGSTKNPNDSVNVQFEFQPIHGDSVWTYKLVFDSKRFGTIIKDYLVRRIGDSQSDYVLDEQDGIIIEMSLMNDCFYDMFEVMGNLYSTTLRKVDDDTLLFDLFMSVKKDGTLTSSKPDDEGNVFEVTSYKPTLHQTIKLNRVN